MWRTISTPATWAKRAVAGAGLVVALCIATSTAYSQQPAELIEGIVARSRAITSGRLTYTFRSESFVGPRALAPVHIPKTTTSFSQTSWAERSKASHLTRINHDGYFLEFVETPQRDGSVRPGATLYPQRSLESRLELNAPPIFAGSFWHREQLRYIEQHANGFQAKGAGTVGAVGVTILELAVPAEDQRHAFHVFLPALKSGGTIRLHVAEQLGFVLPRIEFLGPDKQVAQTYEASSFSEAAPGIYFPRRLWTETHAVAGASRYRGEFELDCELINQTIPEEDFVVRLPAGTRVQDAHRPGDVIKFELGEASSSDNLLSLASPSQRRSGFMDRWQNAVIVGVVIGAVASISFVLAAKNPRSS